jgi:hypothetical protein
MAIAAQLTQLATYLAGEFDNKAQSLADPAWYLHLRLWYRPLPPDLFGEGYGFFIEQCNVAAGQPPYRQRILHLTAQGDRLVGQFYALADPRAYGGSATAPDRLQHLRQAELIDLPTCALAIEYLPATATFTGRLPNDHLCSFTANGVTTYVRLMLDIGPEPTTPDSQPDGPIVLRMGDRGIDPVTSKTTWGPMMGPFCLVKQQAYSLPGHLPTNRP